MARLCSKFALGLVLAAASLSAAPAIASQLIVRSTGPSAKNYPPGKQLPDGAKLELQAGDTVTLLGPGSTRTLRGPGIFPASGGEVAMASNRRARFGALRTGELNLNPSPWNVDVTQSGKVCVADSGQLTLWRPNAADAATLSVTGDGKTVAVDWAAGRATASWPAQIPVKDGARYQLQMAGGDISSVTLATMPARTDEVVATAQALIERGCETQLNALVNGVGKKQK